MGCLCSENTLEEFAEFELVILKLLPTDESTPNKFTITQITETILPKNKGKLFLIYVKQMITLQYQIHLNFQQFKNHLCFIFT